MRKVRSFPTGTGLFNGLDLLGQQVALPGTSYPVEVWYDAPQPYTPVPPDPFTSALLVAASGAMTAGSALPLISLASAGLSFTTLVDSGATHDFISESLVQRLRLPIRSCPWSSVSLADGGKQAILGQVSLRVSAGSFRAC
ncbi:hypothetical protein Vafri_6730, partial [Volvox africanus]